jgi:hypothetical protein
MALVRCIDCSTMIATGRPRCVECHRKLERASGPPKPAPLKTFDRMLLDAKRARPWTRGR